MAKSAVRSKAAVLLLFINCFFGGYHCLSLTLFCYAVLSVLSIFAIILMGKRELIALILIVNLMYCDCLCFVALPRGIVGWY